METIFPWQAQPSYGEWQTISLERLAKIKNEIPTDCYLFGDGLESSHHILLSCPIANLLWWNSNWQIRLEVSNIWR